MTRFLVDTNAGRLARWLRFAGYDAAFYPRGDDRDLVTLAVAEQRVILTRDRGVTLTKAARSLFLESDAWRAQLAQVRQAFGPPEGSERCLDCNALLEPKVPPGGAVPERVREAHSEFWWCPLCQRYFWQGSHLVRMRAELAALGL